MNGISSLPRPLLVGVSGGADSVCLLHLLVELQPKGLVVCHVNHQLRGQESDKDAAFVCSLAQKLGLPIEVREQDVAAFASAQNISVETAARTVRYQFFREISDKYQCSDLALAHHADDQAETVLMNLCRGSYGLKGMRPFHRHDEFELNLWRPLLELRKAGIVEWLKSRNHSWREDATNAEPIATRNRMRLEAIPLLENIMNRDVVPMINRTVHDASQQVIEELISVHDLEDPDGRLFLPKVECFSKETMMMILKCYFEKNGVREVTNEKLRECLSLVFDQSTAKVNLPNGAFFRRKERRLFVAFPV